MINGIIAIVIAYLLGAIPAAYIVTRLATGKDVRRLGGGNVGARNVFQEAGWQAGIIVAIFDIAKGAGAVVIAYRLLEAPLLFVLAAAVAVIAGHVWSVYLKFNGGNGLSPTIGVLSVLLTRELLITLALTLAFAVVTRNLVLSVNISLLSVPVSAWFLEKSGLIVVFIILILLMMALHFIPTAKAALVKAGSRENLLAELLRQDKTKQETR